LLLNYFGFRLKKLSDLAPLNVQLSFEDLVERFRTCGFLPNVQAEIIHGRSLSRANESMPAFHLDATHHGVCTLKMAIVLALDLGLDMVNQ
jgi:hypothetical protein